MAAKGTVQTFLCFAQLCAAPPWGLDSSIRRKNPGEASPTAHTKKPLGKSTQYTL